MPSFRDRLNAIAKKQAPHVMTIVNLVGALSSTSTLLLPSTPTPPVIITPPPPQSWMPLVIEKDEKRWNGLSKDNPTL